MSHEFRTPLNSVLALSRLLLARTDGDLTPEQTRPLSGVADRTRALDGGADSYLVEPIEPDELIATVHALLRMRAAEQEARRINRNLEELVEERTRELAEADQRHRRRDRRIDLLVTDIVMSGSKDSSSPERRSAASGPAGPANVGLPDRIVEKCNFPILHKPYRREQLAMHIRVALGDTVALP
jgi:signal transduction histidine kinase